jgi:hypothetical protein
MPPSLPIQPLTCLDVRRDRATHPALARARRATRPVPSLRAASRCLVLLAAAFALASSSASAHAELIDPTSTSLLPALLDSPNLTRFDPSSPDACTAGKPQCLDRVIREMTKRTDQLIATCAHDATFSLMYLRVTESLREHVATDPMLFEHPDFIRHQDHLFAQMYWRARDLWASGQRSGLPGAWLVALDAAGDRSMPALGDMYLGANAHILADLPVLLYQLGLADENGDSRKPDHDAVNRVLRDSFEPALAEVARRLDPTVSMGDPLPWTTLDGDALFTAGNSWREQAWREAEDLAAAPDATTRQVVFESIENYATAQAVELRATLAYPPLLAPSLRAQRAAYCLANHYH